MKNILKKSLVACSAFLLIGHVNAQQKATAIIKADSGKVTISKHIYGHFAEHLGTGIYGGLWVGEESPIPNTKGIRNDVITALKRIKIPNLRWPGGCFADEYHWMDGIGPRDKRPQMINTNWGGVVENNAFGTHEFMDLCETLGTEAYICGNVGSGTVEEMSKWVEYMTFDGESPMASLRKKNGRNKPWTLKYFGVGNENWGCGGNMTPEFYADQYRRFSTFARNYGTNRLFRIVGGPNSDDYRWMDVMMNNIPLMMMDGVSLHNYTMTDGWNNKGNATSFSEDDYFKLLENGNRMDELVTKHSAVMDKYDPQKRISLVVDEWGAWYNPTPGSNPGFLQQQNTLRDALLAGNILNIFHKHADRVKVANIAQMVNVLQAIILTEGEKMVLTPTYHVFDMYKVHQEATLLPLSLQSPDYVRMGRSMKAISASASKDKTGIIHVSFVNVDPNNDVEISCEIAGIGNAQITSGQIITGKRMDSHNTFDNQSEVELLNFNDAKLKKNQLKIKIPSKSLVTIAIK